MKKIKWFIIVAVAKRLPPCKLIIHRLSDSVDNKLPWRDRLIVRIHLWTCVWCTRYGEQIGFISDAMTKWRDEQTDLPIPGDKLSSDARDRIKRAMRDYES